MSYTFLTINYFNQDLCIYQAGPMHHCMYTLLLLIVVGKTYAYVVPILIIVGKTYAYVVPIVEKLRSIEPHINRSDGPYCIVVVPTREVGRCMILTTRPLLTCMSLYTSHCY